MKRRYERPSAYIEEFTPNEYVAACGDSGPIYKFKCDAGKKNKKYNVYYYDSQHNKKYIASNDWGADWYNGSIFESYSPCKKTHEAKSNSGFIQGFIDDQSTSGDEAKSVYIWTENKTNVHCTDELDMDKWETLKS